MSENKTPLKWIDKSGTYRLTLYKTKTQNFEKNGLGFAATRLFFVDDKGNCLNKNYTAQWPKSVATIVGKMTNTYAKPLSDKASPAELEKYLEPAFGQTADIEIEVSENEWQGKMRHKYKFMKITKFTKDVTLEPQSEIIENEKPSNDVPF
jgi:hypothetical protein